MKKILIVAVLSLALAGCQTAKELATNITTTVETTTQKVKSAQGYAVALCGYLPAASSLISLFNSGFSQSVSVVGNAVCDAVTNITLADGPGDRKPRVNGIVIKGSFVK